MKKMRVMRNIFAGLVLALVSTVVAGQIVSANAKANPPHLAFLGLRFMNDNEKFEPTTAQERARISTTEKQFVSAVANSGTYVITPLTDAVREKIASGQPVGSCGGCEATYGEELHADRVAWMTVQKVSNLILNMNLYVADPQTDKFTFIKSVDIRDNTDESWSRSLKYLLDNYFLPQSQTNSG